ncbi:ABC transporter substrate-binding protein [Nocardiopsis sp. RV163]|uniref:ABC transporter substrate-binding protein n=1 Tax=Nocardiopsis sp. RV163 TaxID=1661388 RepID=UPI001F437CDC|nr:ABC transporter substrate-binding protein [Nocardiopsis sp. RV163]
MGRERAAVGRGRRRAAAAMVLAVAVTGCGAGAGEAGQRSSPGTDGYPVTVQTRHGGVTVEEGPSRVLALGFSAADQALSLGVTPVAVAADPQTLETATPWLAEELAGIADPGLVSADGGPNIEAIASAEPDLILAETYQIPDAATFDQLNAIAPTVAPDSDALNVDWDERLRTTARALRREEEAGELITGIGAAFTEVGGRVPDIGSRTYQWVRADPGHYAFGNGSVLELFGLRPADNQDNTQTGDPLPLERTEELDADVLMVWAPTGEDRDRLAGDPLFQGLPAVEASTVYHADLAFANALNSPAPIGLEWLRGELEPVIDQLA